MTTDEQAIHEIVKQLEAAWNTKDSEAFATPFAEDANFIHIFGGQLDGRRAIAGSHRAIFDTIYKDSHVSFSIRSIRFARADVAIVFSKAHLQVDETREIETRPTMVVVKDRGEWSIVTFQNTKISEIPAAVPQ